MGVGTLIGYFAKQDEARKASRELARQGFRRTALVHKGTDGDVHIADPFFWRRALGVILAASLFGGIAGIAALLLHRPQSLPGWNISPVIPSTWQGFSLRYRHGETIYAIQVENPHGCEHGVAWVEMDGQRVTGGVIPLERGLVKHQVLVRMGE